MAKHTEIDAATLISPKLAVIGVRENVVVLDIDRKVVTHRCKVEEGWLRSAVLSPTGKEIALGLSGGYPVLWTLKTGKLTSFDTSVEIDGEMQSMGGWTINAQPLAWVNASRIVMSMCWGGVIVADLPDGEVQGAKFSEGELWFDDEAMEHKMNDSHWASYADGTVYEVIDDDSLNFYSVTGKEIRLLKHLTPPGDRVWHSGLFVCGEHLIQVGDNMAKVLRKSNYKLVAEHKKTPSILLFDDVEHTRVFVSRKERFFVFDPIKGSWTGCAKLPKTPHIVEASVAGDRLLACHKQSITILDLATGKTVAKLAAAKLV